jgi:hypothetical protein
MSKSKWRYPPPAVIKRAVEAVQRSGLSVSGVRVSEDAVYIETQSTQPSTKVIDAVEWKVAS